MAERHKAVPAVYLFLEHDGKYLLGRRCNTGYQDGNYNVPSGHVEEGELPVEAMIREAREEIGIELTPEDLEFVHFSYRLKHDATGDRVDVFFKANRWSGELRNTEPEKCDDLQWFALDAFPSNMTPHVREAFKAMLDKEVFSEFDKDDLQRLGYTVST